MQKIVGIKTFDHWDCEMILFKFCLLLLLYKSAYSMNIHELKL